MSLIPSFTRIHEVVSYQASERPDAVALYEETGATLTYGGLWQRTQQAAAWLASHGVQAGDRVMIVGENCSDMVVVLFACSVIQAWPVSVNARLSPRELTAIRTHAEPVLALYTCQVSTAAADHASAAGAGLADPAVWTAGCRVAHFDSPSPDLADSDPAVPADRVACVIYTSGTTGAPKGVMVPHAGLIHFGRISSASRRLTPADIGYAALPFSHIFGIATVLMASVMAGASLVVRSRFDAADVFKALVDPGISILQGVPTMFSRLMAVAPPKADGHAAPALRYLYTGGAALDPTLKAAVQDYFGLPMHHGYGITEYAGSMCITDIDAPRDDASAGLPVEGVTVHIGPLSEPSRTGGVTGDIYIKGPGVMLGYYRNPELTAATLHPGGWLDTGDVGYVDATGALFIAGRTKDLIIRSGFNVYPLEVESVINAFPGVRASAVIGVEEADRNEEVVAFVEALPGAAIDTDALRAFLRDRLAPYKRPARIVAIDAMPTTVSGKILKQPLRDRLPA